MVDTATILRQCDVIQSALDAIRAESAASEAKSR